MYFIVTNAIIISTAFRVGRGGDCRAWQLLERSECKNFVLYQAHYVWGGGGGGCVCELRELCFWWVYVKNLFLIKSLSKAVGGDPVEENVLPNV